MKSRIRFLGHPMHPPLTDFPLALWSMSLLCDLVGLWLRDLFWLRVGYWGVVAGLVLAVPTVFAGSIDYLAMPTSHPARPTATRHMILMAAAAVAFAASLVVRGGPQPVLGASAYVATFLSAAGVAALVVGGWFGGHLVFHYGIGREPSGESSEA